MILLILYFLSSLDIPSHIRIVLELVGSLAHYLHHPWAHLRVLLHLGGNKEDAWSYDVVEILCHRKSEQGIEAYHDALSCFGKPWYYIILHVLPIHESQCIFMFQIVEFTIKAVTATHESIKAVVQFCSSPYYPLLVDSHIYVSFLQDNREREVLIDFQESHPYRVGASREVEFAMHHFC